MAPRKRSKKGKVAAEEVSLAGSPNSVMQSGHSANIPSPISIASFTPILASVIDHASPAVLATLMRCNKYLHHIVAPKLYRALRLTTTRFSAMIKDPAPMLAEHLKLTRSLHFERYHYQGVKSKGSIDGLFPNLSTLVVYPIGWRDIDVSSYGYARQEIRPLTLHADQRRLKASSLVVRLSESYVTFWSRCEFAISHLPHHIQSVTLLVPCAWRTSYFPTCFPQWDDDGKEEARSLTIVLLPGLPGRKERKSWTGDKSPDSYRSTIWGWPTAPTCTNHCPGLAVRVVGLEYADIDPQSQWISSRLPRFGTTTTTSRFSEWLDEQEPGVVFTAEQEAILREDDRITWAQRAEENSDSGDTGVGDEGS